MERDKTRRADGGRRAYPWQSATKLAMRAGFGFLRLIGPVNASNLAGAVTAAIGPHLSPSKVADGNLRRALPDLSAAERKRIIVDVWRNLGRNVGELPHLARLKRTESGPGWEFAGAEFLPPGQAIFISAHCGNWEMILPIAAQMGLAVSGAYRRASNPAMEDAIQAMRSAAHGADVSMFAKGAAGARAALLHVARGGSLGLLIDQKMNDGIPAPFFGRMAMTATAPAQFALRFNLPLVPVRVERIGPARLRMICEPALDIPLTGDRTADIAAITFALNRTVEGWVRARPGSWLWLHRRWPKQSKA
ncbi:lauroyl acyltransferase [Acidisoma cellulosilytica]|uniref:Lauroyl acyltransferase n=1 Tax=Acidisoma cellulosilyticum TaxID=2802395 RepID=A0A963Z2Z9_9PROT|nr:lauroyl acyltransferase [Acidisoma cellulosilyticum]MCB8881902.1 lauroyl acyltransferase [Acidisoma cellulosilyticum]